MLSRQCRQAVHSHARVEVGQLDARVHALPGVFSNDDNKSLVSDRLETMELVASYCRKRGNNTRSFTDRVLLSPEKGMEVHTEDERWFGWRWRGLQLRQHLLNMDMSRCILLLLDCIYPRRPFQCRFEHGPVCVWFQ